MKIPLWPLGAAALCLMMSSGCSRTEYVTQVKIEKVYPPEALMQAVEVPSLKGNTNKDVVAWAIQLQEALAAANANLNAIMEWASERD